VVKAEMTERDEKQVEVPDIRKCRNRWRKRKMGRRTGRGGIKRSEEGRQRIERGICF